MKKKFVKSQKRKEYWKILSRNCCIEIQRVKNSDSEHEREFVIADAMLPNIPAETQPYNPSPSS